MAKKPENTNTEMSAVPVKVGRMNAAQMQKASALLGQFRDSGRSVQHDLFPQLNSALSEQGEGAVFAGVAQGEAVKNAVPSTLQPGEFSDTLILKAIGAEGQTVVFYASNGGSKAKLNGIKKGEGVLVFYRGTKASKTKGFSEWHDFGIEVFPKLDDLAQFMLASGL